LFVGAAGERWLTEPSQQRSSPATMLAPETLVGALAAKRAPWVFVGRSGTAYVADSPTGAFLGSSAPLVDMAKVDSGVHNVLAVSRNGELWLSEDAGLGWHQVGPPKVRFADALLAPPFGVALEVPERLWWSDNEGRSWQPLDQPPFGARRLARDDAAGAVVESVLGIRAIVFEGGARLAPLSRSLEPAEPELGFPAARGPSARAIASGRAFDTGGRYFEVVLGPKAETLSGPSLGELDRQNAPQFSACNDVAAAGFESWVYVACTRERSGSARQFEFFRSADAGQSFEREPFVTRGDPDLVRLAVGSNGTLITTGFCAPGEDGAGCRPEGIARREAEADGGVAAALAAVAAPALEEHARGLAFSVDGHTAYAIGPRTKSDALFAFVATDLARGFVARPIAALDDPDARGPTELLQLAASGEGQLSLVLAQPSGAQRLVLLDASGRALSMNAPPVDAAVLGAHGNRALAVSPDGVWQSLNGGAEWESVGRLPRAVCSASAGRCSIAVRCSAAGCTLGESLSRVGWRSRGEPSVVREPPSVARNGGAIRRALGSAIACELSSTEWAELRGVERLPDAAQAALGKAAWFALSTDDATAAAGLWIAEVGRLPHDRSTRIRYSELFGPAANPADVAYHATVQVEGAAALRYRVPAGAAAPGVPLTGIEVVWENLIEGQHRRALIPDAGNASPGDYVKGEGIARRAQPDLVSISSGGIFVRVHRQPQHDQVSYFLDGQSLERVPALRWPALLPKEASLEMARLGNDSVQLAFIDQGATVLRARQRGDTWHFDGMTIGYQDPAAFAIEQHRDIAYAGTGPGIQLTTVRPDNSTDSVLFPLRADGKVFGPPLAVPTQKDLGDGPLGCTAEQRSNTPRTVAPYHPGRRRPLVVHDAVEPERVFLTDSAVLHGIPDAACVDVFDADLVKTSAATALAKERALVSLDGPSWLFRVASDNTRRESRVEYRVMTCRPDAGAEVPGEVYDLPGTSRNE
jgi:hypothetical protein